MTTFWVIFKFCYVDSILLVHLYQKRDLQSLNTMGEKLLVPGPIQFYKEIPLQSCDISFFASIRLEFPPNFMMYRHQ